MKMVFLFNTLIIQWELSFKGQETKTSVSFPIRAGPIKQNEGCPMVMSASVTAP